jgi:hypothetical protein
MTLVLRVLADCQKQLRMEERAALWSPGAQGLNPGFTKHLLCGLAKVTQLF